MTKLMMRNKIHWLLTAFVSMASVSNLAAADEMERLKLKAQELTCFSCHGADGISVSGVWPNLAGQHEAYLIKQLNDFRSGKRKDPMMEPLARKLSDEDIRDLARYYSRLLR